MTTKFQKGKSGNPQGKPKGAKDKRTELRALLQPHAEELVLKAVEMALDGDIAALRICLDRLVPTVKAVSEPVNTDLPTTGTLTEQGIAIYQAMARGEVGVDEAGAFMQVLQGQVRITEASELTSRIEALEVQAKESSNGKARR